MRSLWSRVATAAVLSAACAAGGVLAAGPAQAALPDPIGTFTATSDPGDSVGGGGTYAESTAAGAVFGYGRTYYSGDGTAAGVRVGITPAGASQAWQLAFIAPAGQDLVPGTYSGAVDYPYGSTSPGLNVQRVGYYYCPELTGSFTVLEVVYGTDNYVRAFHATFEQHCDGDPTGPALRGEVRFDNPPQPPPLVLGATIRPDGAVDTATGQATVTGTVTCNQPADLQVSGTITQVVRRSTVTGNWFLLADCTPGAAVPWTVTVTPQGSVGFKPGGADVRTLTHGNDPVTGAAVQVTRTRVVELAP